MALIDQITGFFNNITLDIIISMWVAIAIIFVFRIFRGTFAYIIIKMFKIKEKNSKKIKQNAFYEPLRSFFGFLGIYLAILILSEPFNISDNIMNIITKAFKIIIILTTAIGLANSINTKSTFVKKMQEKSTKDLDKSTIRVIIRVIKAIIYLIAGFMVITELGYNLSGLITGLGISSVVITLAAQDTAKNLIGGLTIVLDKPFKLGDYIKIGDNEGTVEDITFRSTKIRTIDNSVVYIPNLQLSSSSVVNSSQKTRNRYRNLINMELDTSLAKIGSCKTKINKMLMETNGVIQDTIKVKVSNVSQEGIELLIDCFIDTINDDEFTNIKEKINCEIMKVFNDENIVLA